MPTAMNSPSASSLIITMMLFARELSRAPRSSSHVMNITMPNAGRFTSTGMPRHVRRRLQQAMDVGVRAEERRPVAGRQPWRKGEADAPQQRGEVVAPGDRDGHVADGVLEDQIPPDDPRDELSERRVRVGVRAARLRDHRGQLRVAERRQRTRAAEQEEREDERGPGAVANDGAVRRQLPCGRRADRTEDPGADHGADREHDEIAGAEHPPQRLRRCLHR